ncbi:hypothetical protein BC941DRAFT_464977 [Chlamydoabsidia padenii]|nr:hypothetical protein BC941DRAFT_464977 [Chlamydoabsidia padenii]
MINTIETYGQKKKEPDPHRELHGSEKQTTIRTSLPPPFKTKHTNVWPTTLDTFEGRKLEMGTLSSNSLATSVSRLDQAMKPIVGAITTIFSLEKIEVSMATTIYLDQEYVGKALALTERVDFHLPSTYHLCRAAGPVTFTHECQPYSLATLGDLDRGRNHAARIFSDIMEKVLKFGGGAVLGRNHMEAILSNSKGRTETWVKNVLAAFGDNGSVSILANKEVNDKFEDLAASLSQNITNGNISVSDAILRSLTYFDH